MTKKHSKRIDIVSLRVVKEKSISYQKRSISDPSDAAEILQNFMDSYDREVFVLMCLNTKNEPNNLSIVSIGTLNTCLVHPREVFKLAILANSSKVIVAHNHPSGKLEPSNEDVNITERLIEAGKVLGIQVLDHLIIGDGDYYSFKEKGVVF